jgi:hypothetical protein
MFRGGEPGAQQAVPARAQLGASWEEKVKVSDWGAGALFGTRRHEGFSWNTPCAARLRNEGTGIMGGNGTPATNENGPPSPLLTPGYALSFLSKNLISYPQRFHRYTFQTP